MNNNVVGLASLATNEMQPAKAADPAERVQMMGWMLQKQMLTWQAEHPQVPLPAVGCKDFRNDIVKQVLSDAELRDGHGNFLFMIAENLAVTQDLWQIQPFQVNQGVKLSTLETALGRVGKKDLSKKSGTAMVCLDCCRATGLTARLAVVAEHCPRDDARLAHHCVYRRHARP